MTSPALEIRDLTHTFETGAGVTGLNFAVNPGEFILLAGHNGCGKTTLLRLLTGLLRPQSGDIRLDGRDIFKDLLHTRQTMGLIFQNADAQILCETVYSEVAFGPENLKLSTDEIRTRVEKALGETDLLALSNRHPATLSGGEKRRLTIAGVLAMNPSIILFDEPFANLDYPGAQNLAKRIRALHAAGKTIIMATHDMDLVLSSATRILVMEKGEIRADESPRTLAPKLSQFGLRPWCRACQPMELAV